MNAVLVKGGWRSKEEELALRRERVKFLSLGSFIQSFSMVSDSFSKIHFIDSC